MALRARHVLGVVAILVIFAAPAGLTAADRAKSATAIDAAKAQSWIPFEREGQGALFLTVTLNGRPARALLDTGFPILTLSRAYAQAHGLPLRPLGDGRSVGGQTHFDATEVQSLTIGPWSASSATVGVTDLSRLSQMTGKPIDIVLGNSFLASFAIQIDFDTQRLRVLPSGSRPMTGQDVPLGFQPNSGRATIALAIRGQPVGPALIDTGADGELAISDGAWAKLSSTGIKAQTDLAAMGAGGIDISRLATIDRAAFGPVVVPDLQARIEAPGQFLDNAGFAASVGLGALGRTNIVLDMGARRLTLAPRLRPAPPRPRSTVGVQGLYLADRMKILHVMANSPAARGGLRAGDEICAVDDRPVTADWQRPPLAGWSAAAPGTHYDIRLCSERHIRLTTATFY